MKKIIYLIISILLIGCGSRKTNKTKTESKESASTLQVMQSKSDISKTENIDISKRVDENYSTNAKNAQVEQSKSDEQKTSNKLNAENNSEIEKVREYYENGILKYERETSKNYTKLSQEKDYWKASAESLREDYLVLKKDYSILQEYYSFSKNQEELKSYELSKSKSETEKIKKELSKETESNRPMWWLGVLILVIGFGSGFYVKSKI